MPGSRLKRALAREELSGRTYMFSARLCVLAVLAVWLSLTLPFQRTQLYLAAIALFAVLGVPPYIAARRGWRSIWIIFIFLLLDAAVLTVLLITPPPFATEGWTAALNLRLQNFLYLGVFFVSMALSYSPALVFWTGVATALTWSAGVWWVASDPNARSYTSKDVLDRPMAAKDVIAHFLDPRAVSLTGLYNQVIFLALVTLILTVTVWRSRRLVQRQVHAETERSALSRYFSPNIVEQLSNGDNPLDTPSVQPVAVLFADMVGFTTISETMDPHDLIELLRDFHGRLARVVFHHGGTVDKYLGDAILAHFGTPKTGADDPQRALACAAEILKEMERCNAKRGEHGSAPIGVGIGVHYGPAIVGNIGDERRLEYTVLGDTVNVASRLERLTREIGSPVIVSDDLLKAVRAHGGDPEAILPNLEREPSRTVEGRRESVAIWSIRPIDAVGFSV